MNTQSSNQNNNQNRNQPTFGQKNFWGILVAIFLFLFLFQIKSPLYIWMENKEESKIVEAINKNGDKMNSGMDKLGEKIDKVGEKVDKNTQTNKAGFQQVVDTLSAMKKECLSCKEKKPCIKKPRKTKPPCSPVVKAPPSTQKDTTLAKKLKVEPCVEVKPVKKPCEYILWNPDHTKSKVFATAEARKEFADAHGLIIHVQDL